VKRDLGVLLSFYAPEPRDLYRWRVQLNCGCITEALTYKEKQPTGQRPCPHDDDPSSPYRAITSWDDRREVEIEADPVDPPDYWADLDEELWARLRRPEPRTCAFWRVTLACGHHTDAVAPDLKWRPADGARLVRPERLREMIREFEELQAGPASHPSGKLQDEHTARMLNQGWPSPQPEASCFECRSARFITAYRRVGWLAVAVDTGGKSGTERDELQRKLHAAEAKAANLRAQLEQYDQR
jgi:hypothetical protein